jgi:hypothetical protein
MCSDPILVLRDVFGLVLERWVRISIHSLERWVRAMFLRDVFGFLFLVLRDGFGLILERWVRGSMLVLRDGFGLA